MGGGHTSRSGKRRWNDAWRIVYLLSQRPYPWSASYVLLRRLRYWKPIMGDVEIGNCQCRPLSRPWRSPSVTSVSKKLTSDEALSFDWRPPTLRTSDGATQKGNEEGRAPRAAEWGLISLGGFIMNNGNPRISNCRRPSLRLDKNTLFLAVLWCGATVLFRSVVIMENCEVDLMR
ncbi:hypothetical protein F4802DRAFT_264118 [Xylaria palmicola]|nr:hypothetical protein F4802DRAFT_264118 [Xylaria palmicola]